MKQAHRAIVQESIQRINEGNVEGLLALMTPDHVLYVEGEPVLATWDIRSQRERYWVRSPFMFLAIPTSRRSHEMRNEVVDELIVGGGAKVAQGRA